MEKFQTKKRISHINRKGTRFLLMKGDKKMNERADERIEEKVSDNKQPLKRQHQKEKKSHSKLKRWLKRIFIVCIVMIGLLISGYQILIHTDMYEDTLDKAYDRLATMDKESFRKLSNTKIYDNQGEKIGEINTGNYKYLKISDIPIELQNAYIAAEDQNFKHHHGVDYKATIRAGLALIVNKGEITQGGSTITQQVIKNNMLSQEQSFMRKFMEILIAPELEKKYSKHEIMEFYCNSNYYGNGCYGIESASQYYFGKPAEDMTLAECAMMAGVSNSPNNYNPVTSMQLAKKKMYSVLNKMKTLGLITEKEEELAKKQKIIVTQTETEVVGTNNYMTTYAIHCAALELLKNDGFDFEYIFDSESQYKKYQQKYKEIYNEKSSLIRGGGYHIYTSFDMKVQNELQKAVDEQLSGNQQKQENGKYQLQGAGVCIDNKTNYIVGIVGGRGNEDQFNRGFLATRQPGSAIKPLLVYAPAYDNGIISPASVYTDKKIENKGYSPKNAYNKFYGDMNMRRAVAISTNTVAYQVFNDVGQKKALEYLEKMQFSGLRYADNTAVSISLGGFTNGVKVDEMAKAYAALQHDGQWIEKNCIVKLEHEKEGILFKGERAKSKEIYNADAAYMMTDTMQGVLKEGGTADYIKLGGQIAAGKTGTTNAKRDVWFCGYTNYYTTAIWVGNDNNKQLRDTKYAGKIWEQFMNNIHQEKSVSDFKVPDTIEYHNIKSNGNLGNTVYDKSKLDMKKTAYDRRPEGYDLSSGILKNKLLEYQAEKEEKEKLLAAEKAVKEFEQYQITDVNSAKAMEEKYKSASAKVSEVADIKKKSEFNTRLAERYESLRVTYETWLTKIKEYDEEDAVRKQAEAVSQTEKNQEIATEKLHQQRIKSMNEYLKLLSERKYNTDITKELLADAEKCLENCFAYPEHDELKRKFDREVQRISGLPTVVPQPEIPENENDIFPDRNDYPQDIS